MNLHQNPCLAAPPQSLSAPARFARGVERRSVKHTLSLLRRGDVSVKKALNLLLVWQERVQHRKGKQAPTRIQEVAKKVSDLLHKARMLFLTGRGDLIPVLEQLNRAEHVLVRFGSGVCLSGIFSQSVNGKLSKAEAQELLAEAIIQLRECLHRSSGLATAVQQRMSDSAPSRRKAGNDADSDAEEIKETPVAFSAFLDHVKDRGWKVTEPKREEAPLPDEMAQSHDVVLLISGSYSNLLPADIEYGLCQFPILLTRETRLSNAVRRVISTSNIGYQVVTVYGTYTALSGMYLVGVHRRLMTVLDKEISPRRRGEAVMSDPQSVCSPVKNGKKLDLAKFFVFMKVMEAENEDLAPLFRVVSPVGLPVKTTHHYYIPLLPNTLASIPDFSLGEWHPLLRDTPA